jgi:peptide deformylase
MAVLNIVRMGNPVLLRRADAVVDLAADDLARLVADMIETMHDAPGVGLAAPQVNVSLRLIVFWVPKERACDPDAPAGSANGPVPLTVLINPEIEEIGEDRIAGWEQCLSVPGLIGLVPRSRRLRYSGTALNGERIIRRAEGFHARVVQHECDHVDGILYPGRMTDLSSFGFVDEIGRHKAPSPSLSQQQAERNTGGME